MTIKESYDVAGLPDDVGRAGLQGQDRDEERRSSSTACSRRASCSSARRTCRSTWPTGRASTRSTARTNNPWDVSRAPGGSSGGSAAALAAGLTALEAGSDIGSSIRNPAHFCGVYGHKPTWGIVPRAGQALPWQTAPVDIDVVGPLARSADDLAIALAAMAGPDEIEAAGWQLRLRPPRQKRLRDFKVALMLDAPEIAVDREVKDRLQALADFLGRQKAKVDDRARPAIDTREAFSVYVKLLRAATSDRQSDADFEQERGDRARRWPRATRATTRARRAPPCCSHRDWLAANEARHRMRRAWAEFFTNTTCCSAPSPAPPPSRTTRRASATSARWWSTASACRSPTTCSGPATPAPSICRRPPRRAGSRRAGSRSGVQIVGPQYGDLTCLAFARLLEREFQAFVPPPGYA